MIMWVAVTTVAKRSRNNIRLFFSLSSEMLDAVHEILVRVILVGLKEEEAACHVLANGYQVGIDQRGAEGVPTSLVTRGRKCRLKLPQSSFDE